MTNIHQSKAAGLAVSFFASALLVSTAAVAANDKKPPRGNKHNVVAPRPTTPTPAFVPAPVPPPAPIASVNPALPAIIQVAP